jgi:hypothetical protein
VEGRSMELVRVVDCNQKFGTHTYFSAGKTGIIYCITLKGNSLS